VDGRTRLTDSLELADYLDEEKAAAWVGFTGATGKGWEMHSIRNWKFSSSKPFRRADVNLDGRTDISDAVSTLDYLFLGRVISCRDACDINDDNAVDISDPIGLLNYQFLGGIAPLEPFSECGIDPTCDELGCAQSSCS
jgi:hypothetical protein